MVSLWIDALCIDQENDTEKSLQVARMQDIYRKANRVIIWLPRKNEQSSSDVAAAACWLHDLGESEAERTKTIKEPLLTCFKRQSPDHHSKAPFHEVLRLAWFRRIWVVQEAVVARDLVVRLGDTELPWEIFATATLRFMSYLEAEEALEASLSKCFVSARESYFDDETRLGLSMVGLIYALRERTKSLNVTFSPSALVSMCKDCLASLDVDMIYAVAGLFGLSKIRYPIDYKLSTNEVYMAFVVWCIQQEKTLDVLAQQRYEDGITPGSAYLPTWAVNWSNLALNNFNISERSSIHSTISQPTIRPPHVPKCERKGLFLLLKGYILDDIDGGGSSFPVPDVEEHASMSEEYQKLLNVWHKSIPNDPKTNRLIFGDKHPTKETLHKLYVKMMAKESQTSHLWRDGVVQPAEEKRVDYRAAVITERGWLAITFRYFGGMAKLCCLTGGRGLFVLRPLGPNLLTGEMTYSIISGDCFIDGFEDGKGVAMARKMGIKEEEIQLR